MRRPFRTTGRGTCAIAFAKRVNSSFRKLLLAALCFVAHRPVWGNNNANHPFSFSVQESKAVDVARGPLM